MKKLLTILLTLSTAFAFAQAPYPIPSTNIVMGQNTSSTVLIKGSVKINGILTGSTDSLVTIFNGVLRKVPQSQLMSVYTAGYGLLTTGNQFRADTASIGGIVGKDRLNNALALYQRNLSSGYGWNNTSNVGSVDSTTIVSKPYITALNATLPHLATNNTYTGNQQISGAANIYITGNYGFSAPVQYTTLIAPERIRIGGMQDVFDIAPSSIKLTNGPSGSITLLHNNISATRTVNWPNRDGDLLVGGDLTDGLATKQNTLVYDAVPTTASTNSVNSGSVRTAIDLAVTNGAILNQSATPQSATFWINGLAKAGSSSITGNSTVGGDMAVAGSTTTNDLSIYNLGTKGSTDYERVRQYWNNNTFSFLFEKGGTGIDRDIEIKNINASYRMRSASSSSGYHSFAGSSGTAGAVGLNVANTYTASSGNPQSMLAILGVFNQSGTASGRAFWISPYFQTSPSGSQLLIDAGTNTAANGSGTHTSKFTVDNTGKAASIATPTTNNDMVRLTDLKSNKLVTAASATITTAQLLANNGTFYIYVDASGGARTITLLSVAAHLGKTVIIQKTDASANVVTINGGAVNINQATTYPLTTQNASVSIAEDGTQFRAR